MEPRTYTTDELAAELLKYPKGTPVQVTGDDGSGYTVCITPLMYVAPSENVPKVGLAGCVVIMGLGD